MPGPCLVKGGYILAAAHRCACGAVPLQCPACEERRYGTEESTGKLSMYTTGENSPRTLKEMNLPVAAGAFKSRGMMEREEERYLPASGGFLGVAGSACQDSFAKNTRGFCYPLGGSEVEGFLKCLTSPFSGRRFLGGAAEV